MKALGASRNVTKICGGLGSDATKEMLRFFLEHPQALRAH